MASSKLAGGPRVERTPSSVRVVQSKVPGWGLLAFGLGVPGLAAAANPASLRSPGAAWARAVDTLGPLGWGALGVAALFFGSLALYGLVWLAWTRELDVALVGGRWRFKTGFGPWTSEHEGTLSDVRLLHLWRKRIQSPGTAGAEAVGQGSGSLVESWEARLALPGVQEPLFLGEWGLKAEAQAELELWKAVFPNARVDERA